MFPILLDNATNTLKTDDVAAVSALYPASNFSSTTGRIQGHVLFSDGADTPAQGYNVIARLVSDPRRTAVSCVSGYLFTGGRPKIHLRLISLTRNNSTDPGTRLSSAFTIFRVSRRETIRSKWRQSSTRGKYLLSMAPVWDPSALLFSFQYKLPGTCDPQYLNFPSSSGDSCSAKTAVSAGAGVITDTNTDVIFLGTQPRYDSWEDGP